MTQSFTPQPYPLYAVTAVKAEDPIRLELTPEPIHLVLGWVSDDAGTILPALAGSPSLTVWSGAVLYEETRKEAEATAKLMDKAERAMIRDTRIKELFDRFDAYVDRVSSRL